MPADPQRSKKLTIVALIIVNVLVVSALILAYSEYHAAETSLQMNDFAYTNHLPDSNYNTSYVSVQGTINNPGPQTAYNVSLIVEIYVDYQGSLPDYSPIGGTPGNKNTLIKREYLSIGSIENDLSKEFYFQVPYSANTTVPFYFDSVKYRLSWTT